MTTPHQPPNNPFTIEFRGDGLQMTITDSPDSRFFIRVTKLTTEADLPCEHEELNDAEMVQAMEKLMATEMPDAVSASGEPAWNADSLEPIINDPDNPVSSIPCTRLAEYLVEVVDSPETLPPDGEPDVYRYCRYHTTPQLGGYILGF